MIKISKKNKKNGYFYIAHGEKHVLEAVKSLKSIKKFEPDSHATIVTDSKDSLDPFDLIINRPNMGGYKSKVEYMNLTPYEKTLFLDADTFICGSCDELFEMLDYFDICMAQAPAEMQLKHFKPPHKPIAGCVPCNTGVILYSKNRTKDFLELVSKSYACAPDGFYKNHPNKHKSEQLCFQYALMHSSVRFYVIPSIWNMRTDFFVNIKGAVKIVHGRGPKFEAAIKNVNRNTRNRCWHPQRMDIVRTMK